MYIFFSTLGTQTCTLTLINQMLFFVIFKTILHTTIKKIYYISCESVNPSFPTVIYSYTSIQFWVPTHGCNSINTSVSHFEVWTRGGLVRTEKYTIPYLMVYFLESGSSTFIHDRKSSCQLISIPITKHNTSLRTFQLS